MARQVKTLVKALSLPDGRVYPDINTVVTLTDAQFAMLDPAIFSRGFLEDLGVGITLPYAATVNTDASLGDHYRVVLTGPATLAPPTNLVNGQRIVWEIVQDAVGGRVLTLSSIFNLGTLTPTWSSEANKVDYLGAVYRVSANKLDVIAFSGGY